MCQLIPCGGLISRGAGYLLTAPVKINKSDRCWATLETRPWSTQTASPSFYVLHITGLSNHVGIDYCCYYLLNSYFLLLGGEYRLLLTRTVTVNHQRSHS